MELRTRAALEEVQLAKLRRLLAAVAADNPFYRERWKSGVPAADLQSLAEFRARVPFTRKHELVADQAAHPPYGTDLTFPLERYTRCHGTSGSTGRPLRWLDTPETWQCMVGNWRRVFQAAGVTEADRVFFAFSFGPFLGFWTAFEAALGVGCLVLPGGGLTSVARLHSILDQQVTVLCCTPTYALHLAEVACQEKLDLNQSRVRRIIVAGEPGGSVPAVRAAIETGWPGARVFDHHGMTEVGPVSYECPRRSLTLHIMEESYLAEVIDPNTGEPAPEGGMGELVLTTLDRVGSPLIRYRTGDLVRARVSDDACSCGTIEMTLEEGIIGRTDDMVVIRGVNVFPSAIDSAIRELGGVAEYRAEVYSAGALLELRIDIEPGPEIEDHAALAQRLQDSIQTRLALRVPVRVVGQGTLPRFEMKARRWVRTG